MLKPNKNTKISTISKPLLIKSSTPRLDLFSVVPAFKPPLITSSTSHLDLFSVVSSSKPLLYLNLPSSQAAHVGLICSV